MMGRRRHRRRGRRALGDRHRGSLRCLPTAQPPHHGIAELTGSSPGLPTPRGRPWPPFRRLCTPEAHAGGRPESARQRSAPDGTAMASAGSRRTMAAGNPIFPTHLLAGAMVRGSCAATIAQVSGDSDGYYGWLAATKEARENKALVRRTLAEKVILVEAERRVDQLSDDVGAAPAEPRDDLQAASLRVDQGLHEHHPAGTRAADRKMSSDTADRSRSHPPRARHPRHRSPLLRAVTTLDALALKEEPPPLVRRAVLSFCKGGRGRKEFEPPQACRSRRSSSTTPKCRST